MLEELINGTWVRVQLEKSVCGSLLLEAMESLGVDELTAGIIYNAVKKAGHAAFLGDLAQPIKL